LNYKEVRLDSGATIKLAPVRFNRNNMAFLDKLSSVAYSDAGELGEGTLVGLYDLLAECMKYAGNEEKEIEGFLAAVDFPGELPKLITALLPDKASRE
jgi:hypothetical protein